MQIIDGYLILNNGMRVKLPKSSINIEELFDTNTLNRVLINYEMKNGVTYIYISTIDVLPYVFKPVVKRVSVTHQYETVDSKYFINVKRHKGHYVIEIVPKDKIENKPVEDSPKEAIKEEPVEQEPVEKKNEPTEQPKEEVKDEEKPKKAETKKKRSKKKSSTKKTKKRSTSKK